MTRERAAFGPGLRIARERAGVTIEAIAASTKIKASLLAELEQNDLSHWPHGLYRRAFFRDYLAAIGLASESLVAEFGRLFPEDGTGVPVDVPVLDRGEMRLTLAGTPHLTRRSVVSSVAAALIDLGFVFLLAGVASWPTRIGFWTIVAVVALAYYSLPAAFSGRTPGVRWLSGARQTGRPTPAVPAAAAREPLRIVPPPASSPRRHHSPETLAEDAPQTLHAVSG